MRGIKGKTILVSGANGGMGTCIVKRLQEEGARVLGTDIGAEPASHLEPSEYRQADVASERDVRELFAWVDERCERLDGYAHAAGFNRRGTILTIDPEEWDLVINANLRGAFLCCQEAGKRMVRQKGGAIVNIASTAAKVGGKIAGAHYSVSKAGINALTILLAKEVAPSGVRVNSINPGPTNTPFHNQTTEEERQKAYASIPLGRFAYPEEIAGAVTFLLSDDASYVTGEVFDVDGGLVMD